MHEGESKSESGGDRTRITMRQNRVTDQSLACIVLDSVSVVVVVVVLVGAVIGCIFKCKRP